jgi:hypothetical protein
LKSRRGKKGDLACKLEGGTAKEGPRRVEEVERLDEQGKYSKGADQKKKTLGDGRRRYRNANHQRVAKGREKRESDGG